MPEQNKRPGEVWMLLKDRKLLARLIAIQGWSARALAKESGFRSHTYMQRLIRGEARSCTAERAVAICANLQVPLDSLFVANVSTTAGLTASGARPFRQTGTAAGRGTTAAHSPRRGPRVGSGAGKTDAA